MSAKVEIKEGDRYGLLTIIKEIESKTLDCKGTPKRRVLCKCDCGNLYEVDLDNIRRKNATKSCGCLRVKVNEKEVKIGDKFGMLTILKELDSHYSEGGIRTRKFLCKCDCGNTKIAPLYYFKTENPCCDKCSRKVSSEKSRKYNIYETDGDMTKIIDEKGNYTLIDTEDLEKVKPYYFYKGSGDYYVANKMIDKKKVSYFLHRLVTDCPKGLVVDHLNHNRADNRKENLKICTLQDNRKNMPVIGVVLLEHTNKWTASIKDGDSIKYLGVYDTFDEAVEAFRNGA